ncbi:MAG: hypothetical protein ACI90V_011144 [Bacillariaceae sp.]|jgi:hypothetical protein
MILVSHNNSLQNVEINEGDEILRRRERSNQHLPKT